ncbi:MAG: peptidoglycan/xylan/chitin deacetylase (PgdA/CDA1 family) [Myxococcota bacterium]|jgi:peptidoglycan/xylan/chitin deacetylase (PgdA/CDA1 family)
MHFNVCVHDVHPGFAPQLQALFAALRQRLGSVWSAGVVPLPGGQAWTSRGLLAEPGGAEVLLHGCTHRRRSRSPIARWLGGADELVGLTTEQAAARIAQGASALTALTGEVPRGFLPPGAWNGRGTQRTWTSWFTSTG